MAFIYGGWSNSIRIEIPASLNSNSSSSTSSSSSLAPQTANDLIFSLNTTQGVVSAIPGE